MIIPLQHVETIGTKRLGSSGPSGTTMIPLPILGAGGLPGPMLQVLPQATNNIRRTIRLASIGGNIYLSARDFGQVMHDGANGYHPTAFLLTQNRVLIYESAAALYAAADGANVSLSVLIENEEKQ